MKSSATWILATLSFLAASTTTQAGPSAAPKSIKEGGIDFEAIENKIHAGAMAVAIPAQGRPTDGLIEGVRAENGEIVDRKLLGVDHGDDDDDYYYDDDDYYYDDDYYDDYYDDDDDGDEDEYYDDGYYDDAEKEEEGGYFRLGRRAEGRLFPRPPGQEGCAGGSCPYAGAGTAAAGQRPRRPGRPAYTTRIPRIPQ